MRPLRRIDRKTSDEDARRIAAESRLATLATTNEDGTPYCVPILTVLQGDTVYFHCARAGQKLENLQERPKVCLSWVLEYEDLPAEFSTKYASCVATGTARVVLDEAERLAAMRLICQKYAADYLDAPEYEKVMRAFPAVIIVAVALDELCGKANYGKLE